MLPISANSLNLNLRGKEKSATSPHSPMLLDAWEEEETRFKRYQSQTGFREWNFCHSQTEVFLKTSPKWEQLDLSDCLLCSAYEVWPIRLFVLLSLWTFWVTQALLLHDSYLSIWRRLPFPRSTHRSEQLDLAHWLSGIVKSERMSFWSPLITGPSEKNVWGWVLQTYQSLWPLCLPVRRK